MELQFRQLRALVRKNLLLHFGSIAANGTILNFLVVPLFIALFLTVVITNFTPNGTHGVGASSPIRTLGDAMARSGGKPLILVNKANSSGGDIDRVIHAVASQGNERDIFITDSEDILKQKCRTNFLGVSGCFGGAVFHSSPTEGQDHIWHYTLRLDATMGKSNDIRKNDNDAQVYVMPLQHAIDSAISNISVSSGATPLPAIVNNFVFTSKSEQQVKADKILSILDTNITFTTISWMCGIIGVILMSVSSMTKDREIGMTDLIEAMMPNKRRWEPQLIRLAAHYIAHALLIIPGCLILGIAMGKVYFKYSAIIIAVVTFVLGGLALLSFSIMIGACFQRANLSAIIVTVAILILGVIAQLTPLMTDTTTAFVTSALLTPFSFINVIIVILVWEHQSLGIQLNQVPPHEPLSPNWSIAVMWFWVFFSIQIFIYIALAALIERWAHGIPSYRRGRTVKTYSGEDYPVQISNFSKVYKPTFMSRVFGRAKPVVAVEDISLSAPKGQFLLLLGANGCGKSTTLNSIAGFTGFTKGDITISGSIGICPQKNVLWDSISVLDHAKIFNALKTVQKSDVGNDIEDLIEACGLIKKAASNSKSLSGGQKRRLQLLMMLTGGSNISLVDEATGGLDPLSRRKIWNILIAQRGIRTTIFTTHFLDEAEYLADQVVIMSKGKIKAQGTTLDLKNQLGNGYRVHPTLGIETSDQKIVNISDTREVIATIKEYQRHGINDLEISGPTLEDVFVNVASDPENSVEYLVQEMNQKQDQNFGQDNFISRNISLERKPVGPWRQTGILLLKRWSIFRRAPMTALMVFLFPIIATSLLAQTIKSSVNFDCIAADYIESHSTGLTSILSRPKMILGPNEVLAPNSLQLVTQSISNLSQESLGDPSSLFSRAVIAKSIDEFNAITNRDYATIVPGGIYLGDSITPPTFSFVSGTVYTTIYEAIFMQNVFNVLLTNVAIATGYTSFQYGMPDATVFILQFAVYVSLVMAIIPALFTVYVNRERVRNVRAMEYSNGVRPFPLWMAYLIFDSTILILSVVISTILLSVFAKRAFYGIQFLVTIFILYSVAAVLLSYLVSLIAPSHFSAFSLTAVGQFIMLVIYLSTFLVIETGSDPSHIESRLSISYYLVGLFSPLVQLFHSLLEVLNVFQVLCVGSPPVKAAPLGFPILGAPIAFLIGQIIFMFGILMWSEQVFTIRRSKAKNSETKDDSNMNHFVQKEVEEEEKRVSTSHDGLKLQHVDMTYKSFKLGTLDAVKNVSFGVKLGEVFALVGPNGAGKSTTISLLRGDIKPTGGSLSILDKSIVHDLQGARFNLGVCPQHDALEKLTVREHLLFYARIRGIPSSSLAATVESMIQAVGLNPYSDSPTADKLSGGNKRRLSLALALVGDPEVILLDEPTTGMDPMGKRSFWQIAKRFQQDRAIMLTTHSMEEADALASRVGVLSQRLLDIGTVQELRHRHGKHLNMQIVLKSSPTSTEKEMALVTQDIMDRVRGARLVGNPYHGILRFVIPIDHEETESNDSTREIKNNQQSIASLFLFLEESKHQLGIEHFAVSPSSFDEVFLNVLSKHDVQEQEMNATWSSKLRSLVSFKPKSKLKLSSSSV